MRIRNQSRRSRAGRMAAMACAGALALSGCDFDVYSLPLPGGADLGDEQYSVKVEFRDVLDLVPQSSVKVNDVTVGKVTDIEVDVVDVFRRSSAAGEFADQAVAIGARAVWFQLGVIDHDAFRRTTEAGVPMVMDTCPVMEWPRLDHL